MKRVGDFLGMVVTDLLRVAVAMATGWGRSGDDKDPLGLVSEGLLAAWGEGENGGELRRGTCPDSSVFWAEVSELCRPMSSARNLLPGAILPSSPCLW